MELKKIMSLTVKRIMKKQFLFIVLLTIVLLNLGCKKSPTEPVPDNTQPGRRDYVWTVDTLLSDDGFGITAVWGSSPDDIWIVASGASYKDCLWYYDGIKWTKSSQWLSSNFSSLFGIAENDVWAGDSDSRIWRYEGVTWVKYQELSMPGYTYVVTEDINGPSAENLYAVGFVDNNNGSGYKGAILKFDGSKWNFLNIPDMRVGFNYIVNANDGTYLVTATNSDKGFLYKLYTYDGDRNLKEIYSDYDWPTMFKLNGELFVSINKKIFRYQNKGLLLWKDFSGIEYYGNVLGRSTKDFFITGVTGIMHYNGTDTQLLLQTKSNCSGQLIFEKDVFFTEYNSEKGLYMVIRGTLQN